MLVEAAVETLDGALQAAREGAGRLELCGDLARGGITPGPGLLTTVRAALDLPIIVMVRPRPGPFQFSAAECEGMLVDIAQARRAGADGVVIGVLLPDNTIDAGWTRRLVEAASGMAVTFHRAVDRTPDLLVSFDLLASLGVTRVLTSGGAAGAMEGRDVLRGLRQRMGERLSVLPGGGVRASNVRAIVEATGTCEIHVGFPMDAPAGRIRDLTAALSPQG